MRLLRIDFVEKDGGYKHDVYERTNKTTKLLSSVKFSSPLTDDNDIKAFTRDPQGFVEWIGY
jgi:hypothetical protein